MVNKAECSKTFKKICNRTVAVTRREIRTAKNYSRLWPNYSKIRDSINENTKRLISVNIMLQKKSQNIEALKQLDRDREEELENLIEEIKALHEKITTLEKNASQESERNKSLRLQLLRLIVLKTCTKTHISDKKFPHLIQGFTANEAVSKTIPFEIDPDRLTESEIKNSLWENCYRCSSYAKEWDHLFAAESDIS